jgi:hypothetical protein
MQPLPKTSNVAPALAGSPEGDSPSAAGDEDALQLVIRASPCLKPDPARMPPNLGNDS